MNDFPFTVFVVEDDEWYSRLINHSISLIPSIATENFADAGTFLNRLKARRPDVVTLDYRLPDMSGAGVLKMIKDFDEQIEVIVISEQGDIETAVELLKNGAFDYLVKSEDIRQKLVNTIQRLMEKDSMKRRISFLQKEVEEKYSFQKTILGNSKALQEVFDLMVKAAKTNILVLVYGETGTGKELVAKAIHYNSPRKDKPLVTLNMAAIPAELAESELFGHEKGAFTGAISQRVGKFEEADGGTLFLDEIAEMSLPLQAKILRVLQEKEIVRIGGNKRITVDCRIIAATNRNLNEEVTKGTFREDLYYRLLGLNIHLPPLRNRGGDVVLLARFFADRFCKENDITPKSLSDDATLKIQSYHWPGNIRELKSVIESAAVMAGSDTIFAENISLPQEGLKNVMDGKELTMKEYNLRILQWYLNKYNHQVKLVSEKLAISVATIYRMLKQAK